MDLQEFDGQDLYFDVEMPAEVDSLIFMASHSYGTPAAEEYLRKAYFLAPDNLSVLVALYRYYYYQHQYESALTVAGHALKFSGREIDFPSDWQNLTMSHIGAGAIKSMSMVRFYLIALKAAGYINLRLANYDIARAMLNKVVELDSADRLGAAALLAVAQEHLQSNTLENNVRASV